MIVSLVVLPSTPFVKVLVRWTTGKRSTDHVPELSPATNACLIVRLPADVLT